MISTSFAYIRSRMKVLKYKEQGDVFTPEQVAKTKLDKAFHMETTPGSVAKVDPVSNLVNVPVTVWLYYAERRDVLEARDTIVERGEAVIDDLTSNSNALNFSGIKGFLLSGFDLEPLNDSNDNAMVFKIDFIARVLTCK